MNLFFIIAKIADGRIKKFGAQYYTFAIFGIINYPLAYLYEIYYSATVHWSALRLVATALCILLLLKNKFPPQYHKFYPIFWYITLTISLPTLATTMLVTNNFSLSWLINFNIGTMILILLLDSFSFLIIQMLGMILGLLLCYISNEHLNFDELIQNEHLAIFAYMFSCITILGSIFTRNKEIYTDFMQKAKDDMNEYLEQKVKLRTVELEQALSAKTEFLNNMSHEIRTPIQGFTAISEGLVLYWNKFSEEKKLELATQVAGSAKRLGSLVGNLLDLSKFNASRMIMNYSSLELKQIVNEIINECKELYLNNKHLTINLTNSLEESLVQADEGRIAQVIRNLFANAIKFTPDNGSLEISLTKAKLYNQDAIKFSLKDSGMGIPKNELESIFEPFTQSSLTKTKAGGTGLGLTICRHIINAHNGKIWAEHNKENSGSSFNFIIPIIQKNIQITKQEIPDILSSKKANILIIDDEEICLSSMELLLLSTHHSLVKKSSGYEGIQYIKDHQNEIDVILLDLMMPDIDGISVLKSIKQDPKLSTIPVILQSGTSDQTEIQKAYAMGIVSFIHKPYKRDAVLKAISRALELKAN